MIRTRNQIRVVKSETGQLKLISGNPTHSMSSPGASRNRTPGSKVEALYDALGGGGGLNSMQVTALGQNPAFYDTMLTGLASDLEPSNYRFYKDLYSFDTTAGSCVDLMSSMPFSDFSLSGVDEDRLEVYQSAIDQLNLKTFFSEMTVDYLVLGFMCASLMYDSKNKVFTDIISHPPMMCEQIPIPLRSRDPLIRVRQSDDLRQFVQSHDPRVKNLKKSINRDILAALESPEMQLDPTTTLFMARKTFTYDSKGTSLFKRLLPIYFLEKTLYKGTVVEAGRRQRSLLHLAVGDDTWEPTVDELQAIVGLFQQADLDPLGAIIATRAGVNPNEMRQGGDFWKWTDIIDVLGPAKLRALGVSDSFMSGDATYNNAEAGLSVFMENQQGHRERSTYCVLYNKIFPLIAAVNDFRHTNQEKAKKDETAGSSSKLMKQLNNTTKWDMPVVNWKKSLGRDTDSTFMDVLDKLGQKNIPVPLRMYAVAAGVDLESLEDDLVKEKILKAKWAKIVGNPDQGGEGGEDSGGDQGATSEFSSYFGGRKRHALLGRDFGVEGEIVGITKTGKHQYIHNQKLASEQANVKISKAIQKINSDPRVHRDNLKKVQAALGHIPDLYTGGKL